MREELLRPLWQRVFISGFGFVVVTFIVLGLIRYLGLAFYGINFVTIGFLIMWIMPFVFLSAGGRKKIGIKKPESWLWVLISFVIGAVVAGAIYFLGFVLYGTGPENWGMTVAYEYMAGQDAVFEPVVFAVVTFLSMLFSPIGEEFYFRGIIHEVLGEKLSSYKMAGFWSSFLFAAIHLPHHNIFFTAQSFLTGFVPLFIWFAFMFIVSYLFIWARVKSGSILGAILCHSGYILGMNLFVYNVLL
ncbi:Abortive infection protein [Dethiobacter alkaliphilus AHT 1]|uniref:Abortive infection protein n=1 Tax=Dethiobacter alkaliphilus AHT 1 TaxID=555088 RepID=C0GKT0_DETAL|nr:Abortive infection protein [Dethiobacter alkaliphilus AHT 1]